MSERLIALGLRRPLSGDSQQTQQTPASESASFNDRLLSLISDTAIESDTLNTRDFRERLGEYRLRLESATDGDPSTAAIAGDCLSLCQDYLSRSRRYLIEREGEFAEVI